MRTGVCEHSEGSFSSMAKDNIIRFGPQDWEHARNEVIENFTPGTPINEADLFAGRQDTVRQLQDTVLEPGRHAIIFGERGVGKTSIANVFHRSLNTETRRLHVIRINADAADTFDSLWRKVFRRLKRGEEGAICMGGPNARRTDHT